MVREYLSARSRVAREQENATRKRSVLSWPVDVSNPFVSSNLESTDRALSKDEKDQNGFANRGR